MPAEYEVRITPLLRGIPGSLETDGGVTTIAEEETTAVTQFSDLEVVHELNEPRTARVTLSLFDETLLAGSAVPGSLIASLEPFQQALWVGFKRPGEEMSEAVFWGQCNVITDYDAGIVTLEAQDPSLRCQHHYIRRGDAALNLDDDRGRLEAHAASIDYIIEAARNIMEQQDREVPALGLYASYFGNFATPAVEDAPFIEYERGQECWDLIQQVVRSVTGPDMDMSTFPAWAFPLNDGAYTQMDLYDPAGDGSAPAANTELGRNLDPVDANDPQAGDVVFDYGIGLDNLTNVVESPGRPTTHVHVVDADKAYRVTSADADSSYDVGIFVDWVEADFKIPRAEADTTPLLELGQARIKAYGRPPKFFTCTLRPDDAQPHHYGHPNWHFYVPPGVEYIGGDWYIGDFVRVRALRGYRSFSTLARIVGVKLKQEGSNGLPILEVSMIPAVGGTPGTDLEEVATGGGSEVIAPGDDIATATPMGVATAIGISPTGVEAAPTQTAMGVAVASGVSPTDTQEDGPNLVRAVGTELRLAADGSRFSARGMNVHTAGFSFGATHFDAMAGEGVNAQRLCAQWDNIETSPGVFNATELGYVRASIDRAAAEGIKTVLCLGINAPQWSTRANVLPSWSYNSSGPATPVAPWNGQYLWHVFMSHGEAYTRKMFQEFGDDPNVIAVDPWNEPDDVSAANVQAGMNRWLGWARDEPNSAGKLLLVTNLYSSQSADPSFNDWDAIEDWTNVVLQVHSYYAPSSPTDPGWSGSNGMRKSGDGTYWNGWPEASTYDTANKAALREHFEPWKLLSQTYNVPWVLGEFGVQYTKGSSTIRDNWARDIVEAAELEGCAGVFWWIYGVNEAQDPWTARYSSSGNPWRPEALRATTFTAS